MTGLYNIDTEGWVPMRQRPVPPGADPSPESTAMNDLTVEVFVVDRVENPTEN